MDEAIVSHLKHEHRLAIGSRSAEQLKIAEGAAHPGQPSLQVARARPGVRALRGRWISTLEELDRFTTRGRMRRYQRA